MKKFFLFYSSILIFLLMQQISCSIDPIVLQTVLSRIVNDRNYEDLERFLEKLPKELDQFSSEDEAQQKIDSIFIKPIQEAIIKNEYNIAYYILKKSQFNLKINTSRQVIQPNLLFKEINNNSIVTEITKANNPLLTTLAHSWIASNFSEILNQETEEESLEESEQSGKEINMLKHFIEALKKTGINWDEVKKIVYQVLIIHEKNNDEILLKKLKKSGLNLRNYSKSLECRATLLLTKALKLPFNKLKEHLPSIIEKGAQINERSILDENTVLIKALDRNLSPEIIKLLLDNKANVNEWGAWGTTPLLVATTQGNVDNIKQLIAYGAQVNDQDIFGQTALMVIIKDLYHTHIGIANEESTISRETADQIIQELIKHGANPSIKDAYGQTPLEYAKEINNPEIIALLEEHVPKLDLSSTLSIQEQVQTLQNLKIYLMSLPKL